MKLETLMAMPDAVLGSVGSVEAALEQERAARVSEAVIREETLQMWEQIVDRCEVR